MRNKFVSTSDDPVGLDAAIDLQGQAFTRVFVGDRQTTSTVGLRLSDRGIKSQVQTWSLCSLGGADNCDRRDRDVRFFTPLTRHFQPFLSDAVAGFV